jgi:hypothetical protein
MPRLIPPHMDAQLEANLHRIPFYMRDGLADYIRFGQPPGHFLLAVLCNDLKEACGRADETNQRALYDYVYVLANYAPMGCWGDADKVRAWIQKGSEARRLALEAES